MDRLKFIRENPRFSSDLYIIARAQPSDDRSFEKLKIYVYFSDKWSSSLYEIDVPDLLSVRPPTKETQEAEISNPRPLSPVLRLKTGLTGGRYPEGMSCVHLESRLYFIGCQFNLDNPPREVYYFDLPMFNKYRFLDEQFEELLCLANPMQCGKPQPQTFVIDGMIYVLGSTVRNLDVKNSALFEVYNSRRDMWSLLPNPPIANLETRWVGHTVLGRKVVFVALQLGRKRLYRFDLDTLQWNNRVSIPDYTDSCYPSNTDWFLNKSEFVDDTLYGCCHLTIGAIAPRPLVEVEVEVEEEEEEEEEEVQPIERLLDNHGFYEISDRMGGVGGTESLSKVPIQLQSNQCLLHFGHKTFCRVMTGVPPYKSQIGMHSCDDIDNKRFISIVIFQALNDTFKENTIDTNFFRAIFLYSAHYEVSVPFPIDQNDRMAYNHGLEFLTCHNVIIGKEVQQKNLDGQSYLDGMGSWVMEPTQLIRDHIIAPGSLYDWYKGTYHNQDVAIKVLKDEHMKLEFAQEAVLMMRIKHPNVIKFIGICTTLPMCIVTEYMSGGSIYDLLHVQKHDFTLSSIIQIAMDVAKGMNYLHCAHIIHRDLKSANLWMDGNRVVKIAEFGIARIREPTPYGVMTAEIGTFRWMAPEVIDHKPYNHKADVFSFGVLLWELLTGKLPYEHLTPLQAAVGIVQQGLRPTIEGNTDPELVSLLERCWDKNSSERPDFSEILEILRSVANKAADDESGPAE